MSKNQGGFQEKYIKSGLFLVKSKKTLQIQEYQRKWEPSNNEMIGYDPPSGKT